MTFSRCTVFTGNPVWAALPHPILFIGVVVACSSEGEGWKEWKWLVGDDDSGVAMAEDQEEAQQVRRQ